MLSADGIFVSGVWKGDFRSFSMIGAVQFFLIFRSILRCFKCHLVFGYAVCWWNLCAYVDFVHLRPGVICWMLRFLNLGAECAEACKRVIWVLIMNISSVCGWVFIFGLRSPIAWVVSFIGLSPGSFFLYPLVLFRACFTRSGVVAFRTSHAFEYWLLCNSARLALERIWLSFVVMLGSFISVVDLRSINILALGMYSCGELHFFRLCFVQWDGIPPLGLLYSVCFLSLFMQVVVFLII